MIALTSPDFLHGRERIMRDSDASINKTVKLIFHPIVWKAGSGLLVEDGVCLGVYYEYRSVGKVTSKFTKRAHRNVIIQ